MPQVLIIEDDPMIRDQYTTVLRRQGFVVLEARDTKEGLEQLANSQPQLIILDILMPGDNGIAFLKAADIPRRYPETKVLAASNVEMPEFVKELEKLKVDRFILKSDYNPFRLAELVREMIG